ncbi:MAG: hypothetical protein NC110_07960, partial [Ruminococcus sp.]|nr:hypothetical protein [Ruminococcus sp.]
VYNELIRDVFKPAEKEISLKIAEVENGLKSAKRDEVVEYFEEYAKAKGIDFLTFDSLRINITLSASVKSLKKQVKDFIDKTINDLALIATQDHSTEILVEYRRTLDVSYSIMAVKDRHRAIAEEKQRIEAAFAHEQQQQESIAKVDEAIAEFSAPTVEEPVQEENEPVYTTTFTVRGTMSQLKELKKFLKEGVYDYE